MNGEMLVRLDVAHVLRRQEAKLAVRFLLRFVQQQHRHHVPVDLVGKHVVLVQKVERRVHAGPQRDEERHRRVGPLAPGQRLGVGDRVRDVLVPGHDRQRQRAVLRIDQDFPDKAAQLHHGLKGLSLVSFA